VYARVCLCLRSCGLEVAVEMVVVGGWVGGWGGIKQISRKHPKNQLKPPCFLPQKLLTATMS
jgi:hypothetical protein